MTQYLYTLQNDCHSCSLNPLALLLAFIMASSFSLAVSEFVYVFTWFHLALTYLLLNILVLAIPVIPLGMWLYSAGQHGISLSLRLCLLK